MFINFVHNVITLLVVCDLYENEGRDQYMYMILCDTFSSKTSNYLENILERK